MSIDDLTDQARRTLEAGGRFPTRDVSNDPRFLASVEECLQNGFVMNDEALKILKQFHGLKFCEADSLEITFEHPEYVYAQDNIVSWIDDSVQIFPIGTCNGDPMFISDSGEFYLTNYDCIAKGRGSFYASISALFEKGFFSRKNSISEVLPD